MPATRTTPATPAVTADTDTTIDLRDDWRRPLRSGSPLGRTDPLPAAAWGEPRFCDVLTLRIALGRETASGHGLDGPGRSFSPVPHEDQTVGIPVSEPPGWIGTDTGNETPLILGIRDGHHHGDPPP